MNSNSKYPLEKLIKAIETGNCVAFVGSGFSAAAGYPDWKELLSGIADELWPEIGINSHGTLLKILGPKANRQVIQLPLR